MFLSREETVVSCFVKQRLYFYSLGATVVFNTISILIAMAFTNALNESARDADVIRIFAEGKGYVATKNVQLSFGYGLLSLLVTILVLLSIYLTIFDMLLLGSLMSYLFYSKYVDTARLLFKCSSLTAYWRWGYANTNADPYDLSQPYQ